ncbi:MAG: hypothetical protein ACK4M9_05995 [Anaerobacillus sp.]|uniref:hypothetical protein n=1 Tax=Anaerobacillus sp. TaxID=1872506 RepID=UPI00391BDE7F
MKKKLLLVITTIVVLVMILFNYLFNNVDVNSERIVVNGIENFNPTADRSGTKESYLLFYPADSRVSQGATLVKEVTTDGEVMKVYEIKDDEFRRMEIHQKPNEINKLYISLFGEAVINNWYYTFDIDQQRFNKVDIEYFNYDVGVDHIKHYGPDVLFQTIVSYKTGDQNYDPETGLFNMSISNYTTEKSYETEYGYPPNWSPILQSGDTVIYAGNGQVNDAGIAENAFVALINSQTGLVEYTNFDRQSTEFFPLYATDEYAYIIGNAGKIFVLDNENNYSTYEPFNDLLPQDYYYNIDGFGTLLISDGVVLHYLYSETAGITLGLLSLIGEPTFTPLDKSYIDKDNSYRILYQDTINEEIYLLESTSNNDGNLLVINNQSFDLIHKIPIEYEYLLDFVIKNE